MQIKQETQVKSNVINLSHKHMFTTKFNLFNGLKFTPTSRGSDQNNIKDSVAEFCRKLRLPEASDDFDDNEKSWVKNKSEYTSTKRQKNKSRSIP